MEKGKLIAILTPITVVLLLLLILFSVTVSMTSMTYLNRVITHWDSSVKDVNLFPQREVEKAFSPYQYMRPFDQSYLSSFRINYIKNNKTLSKDLKGFIKDTKTTSLIAVRGDINVLEDYGNGYFNNSLYTSFSMTKSVVSLLIGKAVEEGYIDSIKQPISDYVEEFKGLEIGKNTIEDLLLMRSNIVYEEDKFLWFGDDSLTYWSDDLRKLALEHTQTTDEYNGKFHYNNYHPLLLGIILERTTGVSISEYFQKKLWEPLGTEYDASWSLDSEKSGFEKMESGINFRPIDFIKIGSMVLRDGKLMAEQIISEEWLKQSTLCEFPIDKSEYEGTFLEGKNIGYKYMWYTCPNPKAGYDIIAWGKSDQILYISPTYNTVILRTGISDGGVSDWISTLQGIARDVSKLDLKIYPSIIH
ncbi:MAG: beta-lactamase family protein [Clostridia bacterium]|nr:beta-lactamase family protein [Clostridia bacterium]